MTTHIFTEAIDLTEASLDTDNRVLRDVVLIRAGESANKRDYPAAVLQASIPVFEGVKSYADHPSRSDLKERSERSIRDITGWYDNVRYDGTRLVADRHFTPTQAGQDAWGLAEMVASGKAPKTLAGLSINAVGTAKKRGDGGMVVESITFAHSVDDVTTPAAGGSYIESIQDGDLTAALFEALDYDEWLSLRPEFKDRFEHEHRKVRWNAELKAAKVEVGEYTAAVEALEATIAQLTEQRDAARQDAEQAGRLVHIADLLAQVSLPASWKADLKSAMMEAEPEQWPAIIQRNLSKAKSAGHKPKVAVDVPLPPTVAPMRVVAQEQLAPYDNEDPQQYAARIQRLKEQGQ